MKIHTNHDRGINCNIHHEYKENALAIQSDPHVLATCSGLRQKVDHVFLVQNYLLNMEILMEILNFVFVTHLINVKYYLII